MKGKNTIIIFSIVLLSFGWGQLLSDLPTLERPETMHLNLNRTAGLSLLDPARFDMKHGFSMSMVSDGGLSFSVGSYTNQMTYWVNSNLRLDTDITLYQPMANNPLSNNQTFNTGLLYKTTLTYRPSENSFISFSVGNNPYATNLYTARRAYSPFQLRAY